MIVFTPLGNWVCEVIRIELVGVISEQVKVTFWLQLSTPVGWDIGPEK